MTKRVLNIFVGYQIVSTFHNSEELKTVMVKKIAPAIKKKLGIKVEFKFGDKFALGDFLFNQVKDAINSCEIALFDISENNPNVMLEVGLALGAKKFTIVLKNESSTMEFRVPSDLQAFIYLPYKNIESITAEIVGAIANYNKNLTPAHFYFNQLWRFGHSDTVYIVCPELTEPDKRQNPEDNEFLYLGKYGDIDSLLVLYSSLSKLFPSIDIRYCTGREFKNLPGNPYSENLILLGGPDYNEVTKYYLDKTDLIPYKFVETAEEDIGIQHPHTKEIFLSNFDKNENLNSVIDHGFFVKASNPANPSKKIIMVNGIHTYGVYGAAKCFSLHQDNEIEVSTDNCKRVIEAIGNNSNFAAHFQVSNIHYKTSVPIVNTANIFKL